MISFFARANSVEEAVRLHAEHPNALFLAGGTDVAVDCYKNHDAYEELIDLSGIEALRGIRPGTCSIGALTTFTDLLRCQDNSAEMRLLRQMARKVAATQIRSRATIGGNVANGNPAADSLPVLSVLDTVLVLQDSEGQREIALEEYLRRRKEGSGRGLLCALRYRPLEQGSQSVFAKVGRRRNLSIARINACVVLRTEDHSIRNVRISIGAVSPVTHRFIQTEQALVGMRCHEDTWLAAGDAVYEEARPYLEGRESGAYKLPVLRDLVPELLRQCCKNREE